MTDQRNRYPGAQPFSDDDVSRKVFFGRDSAARELADKILANHVVTVYARSGLGKTSLLKAGVAPLLREEGYLPLFVRVNDLRIGPFRALLETVPGEAARQHIEYVPGRWESLWTFFKTSEFWRGDLLLTPVLVLDQFEELFTLQSEEVRAHFLNELSYLIRGVRPPPDEETPPGEELSEHPPPLRIVLSLREDCLGLLEDAAEHIPQILDARFRLAPLDLDAAHQAIVGPAAVTDPGLETRPFTLDRTAVDAILDYLSRVRTRTVGETRRYVEPFQLQLICRRMEQIAGTRQKASRADLTITMADLGGDAGLTQTLRDFYRDAIESLPDPLLRSASRRLCEQYLISPEGRRLSLEEHEIHRQLHLRRGTLDRLVARRLLRSDNRSDSTYYELSHDALIEPILTSRRKKSFGTGLPALFGGAIVALTGLLLFSFMAMIAFGPIPSVRSIAQEVELGDYVDNRIANGIGLDTLVYLVGGAAMLTAGWRLGRWGAYRLAGISAQQTPSTPRRTGRSAVLYAASRLLLGGMSLLSAVMLVGFGILKVQCGNLAPGSTPAWLDAWFNMLAIDCRAGYPDGVAWDLGTDLLLLTALLFVAIPTLRRGLVATRQIFPRASGKPAIARDLAEQFS